MLTVLWKISKIYDNVNIILIKIYIIVNKLSKDRDYEVKYNAIMLETYIDLYFEKKVWCKYNAR